MTSTTDDDQVYMQARYDKFYFSKMVDFMRKRNKNGIGKRLKGKRVKITE